MPIDGIIIVTSPQDLVSMIVEKAINMAKLMNIPVIGIVENMSYFKCPDCGNIHYIYGKSKIDEVAAANDIKTVAKLPMDAKVAGLVIRILYRADGCCMGEDGLLRLLV